MANTDWWQKLNLGDLQNVSAILLRAVQATGNNRIKAIKVPRSLFIEKNVHFYYPLIEQIQARVPCFELLNKREDLYDLFFLQGVSKDDYITHIVIRIIDKNTIETLQKFNDKIQGNQGGAMQELSNGKISPTAKKRIKDIIIICKLVRKEAKFLNTLSDLKPHETISFTNSIPTRNYKKLKSVVQKKIKGQGMNIKLIRASWPKSAYYQLEYLPSPTK